MRSGGLETLIMNIYRNINREKVQFDFLYHYTKKSFYDDEILSLGGRIYRLSFREDNNIVKYLVDLDNFFSEHKEYNVIHGHMASLAVFYLYYAKKYNVGLRIIHSHNASTEKSLKGFLKKNMLHLSTIYANQFFACGQKAGHFLYGKKDFQIIKNAIDIDKFRYDEGIRKEYRNKLGLKSEYVIGHVGRFNVQKNHEFIIRLFHHIIQYEKNVKLLLIGTGELEDEIKDLVDRLNINDDVIFLGARRDVNCLYQAMDVFLLPSLFEGLPVVGIECQAAGLPMVLSDNVTKEVDVVGNNIFESLDNSYDCWMDDVMSFRGRKRQNNEQILIDAGYSIADETEKLEKYYIKMYMKMEGEKC
jgi:glycosyltransferase involved in cell wall biosynthesis